MKFLLATILFLTAFSARAATITAATTSRADVLTAVNSAASGDTVNIPAGTSTWTTPITLTKAITLNGNGTNNTVIQNSQSAGTGYDNSLIAINLTVGEKDKVLTIQNIKFVSTVTPASGSGGNVGISPAGSVFPTKIRITQCFFTKFNFAIVPYWFGVCDHCEFYNNRDCVRWPCVSSADLPSSPPFAWDTGNWFFAEDCDFVQDAGQNSYQYINMDSEGPSCQVVRYSRYKLTISGSFYQLFDMHGSGNCGGQSSVGILSYKNVVTCAVGDTIQFADIRGGTGSLCYSNTCNGSAYVTIRTDPAGSAAPVNTHDWSNTDKTGIIDGTSLPSGFAQYTYPHPLVASDVTAPTLTSATIPAAGNVLNLVFNESVTFGAGGNSGWSFTMSGGAVTATYSSGSGSSTLVYSLSRTVGVGETKTAGLNYTQPGDGVEDTSGNDLATISGTTVVNNSTADITVPTLTSATIPTAGNVLNLVFSEAVRFGAGGNSGWTFAMSGGAVTATYSSGVSNSTLVYSLSRVVNAGETKTSGLNYTQPANGVEDISGNDLAAINNAVVVNNSTQDTIAPTLVTATIPAAGNVINLAFSEAVTIGTGGNAGWSLTMSGGAVTLTYASGAGTSTLVYTLSRVVNLEETKTAGLNYTQPLNGIEDVGNANDLASISGSPVVNNSTRSALAAVAASGRVVMGGYVKMQ